MQHTHGFEIREVDVGSQKLRVAIKRGRSAIPLVIFNGIGANLELLEGVAQALHDIEVVTFDVPGAGGSPLPRRPYRFRTLARMTERMLDALGYPVPWMRWAFHGVERSRNNSRERLRVAAVVSCLPPLRQGR